MMRTEDLIDQLASGVVAVGQQRPWPRIAIGLAVGTLISAILVATTLGLRPDLDLAMKGPMFWMKAAYASSIALIALVAAATLRHPDASSPRLAMLLIVPIGAMATLAAIELADAPPDHRMEMWLGQSWQSCSLLVAAFALPILAMLTVVWRRFAPTRLRTTGALLGCLAGAASALVYCLHCPEATVSFVLTWYSLGIAIAAATGAAIGPRLLRW